MAHLCRELFPTLLEKEGLLYDLISNNFVTNKHLYDDLIDESCYFEFKDFLYSLCDVEKKEVIVKKTPKELLDEAGYDLFECKSEEDILSFKKYYAPWEELCSFKYDRLEKNYVFFAVKKNVDEIKRENFTKPQRQDEYGTSVISIQFTKGKNNTVSIKNRYNHTVDNPDATFSNDLDNIIPGLNNAFKDYYHLNIDLCEKEYNIVGYVKAEDNKYYKYNYEINGVYYCPNNIIVDNYKIIREFVDGSRYIIMDYFILDLKEKKISLYGDINNNFINININKNTVEKLDNGNRIITINDKNEIIIDGCNRIISYKDIERESIGNNFLENNNYLENISLPNVRVIGRNFLRNNNSLKSVDLPQVNIIYNNFLKNNNVLEKIDLPNLSYIRDYFMSFNTSLTDIKIDNVEEIGNSFLKSNNRIEKISLPMVKTIGSNFLNWNVELEDIFLPNVEKIDSNFLHNNNVIKHLFFPKLKEVGDGFMYYNKTVE